MAPQDALNAADLKFAVGTTEAKMDMALGDSRTTIHSTYLTALYAH